MNRCPRFALLMSALAVCSISAPERAAAIAFIFETVDNGPDVGRNNSQALDSSGNPHVAYWDFFFGDLKYAVRIGGVWSNQILDAGVQAGQSPSIALDSSGNPCVAYLKVGNPQNLVLKYAERKGAGWSFTEFDPAEDVGLWPSLALDSNDDPCISHYDLTKRDLLYQFWNGIGWTIERPDTVGWVGGNSSLALDSMGRPHISYYDQTNLDLKYAVKIGGVWMVETIADPSQVGSSSSIALDSSDNPHIAYYNASAGALQYVKKSGGNWIGDVVDFNGNTGINVSMVLDGSDQPHMSYHENIDDDLYYATGDIGNWSIVKVDSVNEVGFDSSIQLDQKGLPIISYYDFTLKDLRFTEGVHPVRVPDHFPTIQLALDAACEGDSVLVAPGTYSGNGNRNLRFRGKDLVLIAEGGPGSATINAGGAAPGFWFTDGETSASIVDGFRIQSTTTAGIWCNNSSPTIRNCEVCFIFTGNGIFLNPSNSLIEDCVIRDNQGTLEGAGIRIQGGAPTIRNCEILNNDSDVREGGGMWIQSSTASIENCNFQGNTSRDHGAGIFIDGTSSPTIVGCTFEGNRAGDLVFDSRGGAIYGEFTTAPITISGCRFRGNRAFDGGAIAFHTFTRAEVTIEDCLFNANSSRNNGGAMWFRGYNPTILGCTIATNRADVLGGGIHFADDDTALIERTIIWENCADTDGDEIYFDSILPDIDVEATFICCDVDSFGFSGPGSWVFLADNIFEDPVFVEAATCQLLPDWPGFDLDCGSPCLASVSPCGETIGAGEEACAVAIFDMEKPAGVLYLHPTFPNPFAATTQIRFGIARSGEVSLRAYDLRGRIVRHLFSGRREAGPGALVWDGHDDDGHRLAPGVYFIRLEAGESVATLRTVLLAAGN